jgi:hypothetical protein
MALRGKCRLVQVLLSTRKLKFKIKPLKVSKNLFSDSGTLKQGAPQEPVLGTSWFIIYVTFF